MPPLGGTPTSVLLRATDARIADVCGFALARSADPQFALLEFLGPGDPRESDRLPWGSLVDVDRHFIVHAPGAGRAPEEGPAPAAWTIARASAPEVPLASLLDFLTSPAASGRLFGGYLPPTRPLPILVANGGPAARSFPDDPVSTSRLLELQRLHGFLTVFASDATPRRDYAAFDFAFDVVPHRTGWESWKLRCARGPPGSSVRPGDDLPFALVPEWAEAFGKLPPGFLDRFRATDDLAPAPVA